MVYVNYLGDRKAYAKFENVLYTYKLAKQEHGAHRRDWSSNVDIIEERHRCLGLKKGCAMSLKNALAPWYGMLSGRISCLRNTCLFFLANSLRVAYFLPLFLMPWLPVFRGPLPPAFLASSSRAFLSVAKPLDSCHSLQHRAWCPTGCQLGLVSLVVLILLDDLLLGLLVVNWVGTR